MTTAHKSAAEIEREVEAQRAGLAHTLDEISGRLTPGQILDEAWELARDSGGGAFARNLGTSVRDNPLPVGLITAGIAWLMTGRGGGLPRMPRTNGRSREKLVRTDLLDEDLESPLAYGRPGAADAVGSAPLDTSYDGYAGSGRPGGARSDGAPGVLKKAAGSVAATAASATAAVRDHIGSAAGTAGDAARIAMEDAQAGAGQLGRSASESARHLRDRTRETGRQVRDRAEAFADEQPVVLAVAGLAIGALVGALARSTVAESRLMGKASDDLKDRAMDAAASGADKMAGVVERTYDAVREEAENEGLTSSSVREAADDVTRKVKKVAKKAQTKLEEEFGAASGSSTDSG